MPHTCISILVGTVVSGTAGGFAIFAQTTSITSESTITIIMAVAAIGGSFTAGIVLNNIRRDIRDIKSKLRHLKCMHGDSCPEDL